MYFNLHLRSIFRLFFQYLYPFFISVEDLHRYKSSPEDNKLNDPLVILLVTYFRSGSSITAEIIEKSKNVFYVYEPFTEALRNSIYNGDVICNMMNGKCR